MKSVTDKKSSSVEAMSTVDTNDVKGIILNEFFDNADESIYNFLRWALAVAFALEF